jgi:hypothetical protein
MKASTAGAIDIEGATMVPGAYTGGSVGLKGNGPKELHDSVSVCKQKFGYGRVLPGQYLPDDHPRGSHRALCIFCGV